MHQYLPHTNQNTKGGQGGRKTTRLDCYERAQRAARPTPTAALTVQLGQGRKRCNCVKYAENAAELTTEAASKVAAMGLGCPTLSDKTSEEHLRVQQKSYTVEMESPPYPKQRTLARHQP